MASMPLALEKEVNIINEPYVVILQSPSDKSVAASEINKMGKLHKHGYEPEISDKEIAKICMKYGLRFRIGCNIIYIKTERSSWRVYHDDYYMTGVFHENHKFIQGSHKLCGFSGKSCKKDAGFHKQKMKCISLDQICKYIKEHDTSVTTYKPARKSRIERLFEQIEKQEGIKV